MNITLIVTIAILAICAFAGYNKGLVKTVFSTCSLIAALILTIWLNPMVSKGLQSNDEVMDFFKTKVQEVMKLSEFEAQNQNLGSAEFIEALGLPEIIEEMLTENMGDYIQSTAVETEELTDKIAESIAGVIITALSFLGLLILLYIAIYLVGKLLDLISKLPLIKQVNKISGLALGFVEGLIIVWILCIVLTAMTGTELGQTILKQVNESGFLSTIYNNNLLLHFVTSSVSKFF